MPHSAAPLEFLRALLDETSPIVAERFGHTGPLRFKQDDQAITAVDAQVESVLRARLSAAFPDHAVVGEEEGRTGPEGAAAVWHVDPIDGTLNYAVGVPFFCTSIGLVVDGIPTLAAIADPLRDHVWTAEVGRGAWRDGLPLRVSAQTELRAAIVSHQSSRSGRFVRDRRILSDIQTIPLKTRRLGSIALELAYVADATFDLLVASKRMEQNLYDVAAGILLVTEAGGRVTNGDGNPFSEGDRELIASNGALHDQAVALVAERGEATS